MSSWLNFLIMVVVLHVQIQNALPAVLVCSSHRKGLCTHSTSGTIQPSKVQTQNLGLRIRRTWNRTNGSVALGLETPHFQELLISSNGVPNRWVGRTWNITWVLASSGFGPAQLPNYFRSFPSFASSALAHSTLEFLVTTLKSLLWFCFPLQAKLVPLEASRKRTPDRDVLFPHCFSFASPITNHHHTSDSTVPWFSIFDAIHSIPILA